MEAVKRGAGCGAARGLKGPRVLAFLLLQPLPPLPIPDPPQTDWLDNKHVVFGRVLTDSMLVVRKLEAVQTGQNNKPKLPCTITECGEM